MQKRVLPPLAPFIILTILSTTYGLTLAGGLSWANGGADGGDLITAAAVNGVPHPTGYPLYLILADIFQRLPIGNLAYRTNLMSAMCSVGAAFLLYLVGRRIFEDVPYREMAACAASLSFGLAPLVWSQAVITEVYALQALLSVAILYQALFALPGMFANFWRGILVGLALGNHVTSLFLVPLLLWERNVLRLGPGRRLIGCAVGLGIGLLVYLILPLRAAGAPAVNWNNPGTIGSFYQLVSGQIYQGYFSLGFVVERARGWLGLMLEQFTLLGFTLGVFGLLEDWKNIRQSLVLMWVFVIYTIFALVYSSYDSYVYLIPVVLVFSVWLGKGIQAMMQSAATHLRWSPRLIGVLLATMLVAQIAIGASKVDASKDGRAESFGRQVLATAPQNGILVASGDQAIFALWYFHFALHERPDVIVVASGLLNFDWYREGLRHVYPSLAVPEPYLGLLAMLERNSTHPVCYVEWNERMEMTCAPK